jgi:diguanylate cyclase (GGDEF)-like protein
MTCDCGQDDKRIWLRKAEIFSPLDDQGLDIVSDHSVYLSIPSGSCVFNENDPSDALFIVVEGTIRITKQTDGDTPSVIAELIPGDSFGELEFLTGSSRNATAIAASDACLIRFPGGDEGRTLNLGGHLLVRAKVLHSFLNLIANRIRTSNNLLKENSLWVQELKRQVYGDKLTGLFNKTYLEEELPVLLKGSSKNTSLLLMKPDNFKHINDSFGHEAGDESLKLMAAELKRQVGDAGNCFKYMGNELGVILDGFDGKSARIIAEKVRAAFNAIDITAYTGGVPFVITVSVGIATHPDHGADAETIVAKAHELPLAGRARGGNQILTPEDIQ